MDSRESLAKRRPDFLGRVHNNPLLLFLLIAADLIFVAMFGLLGLNLIEDEGFWLTQDRSYAEIYQYVKMFWLVLCFACAAVAVRESLYAVLSIIFGLLLLDDYLAFHEEYGQVIADMLQLPDALMLVSSDYGELVLFSLYGVVFVPTFAMGYRFASKATRKHAVVVLGYVLAFAFFAVVVDVFHSLRLPFVVRNVIGAVEDGGEMIVISGMCWYVYGVANRCLTRQDHASQS